MCVKPAAGRVQSFSGRAATGLGGTLVALGLVVIVIQIAVLVIYNVGPNVISHGIWCGAAFVICGVFGIVAGRRQTMGWIVTFLVLCVVFCFFGGALVALASVSAALNGVFHNGGSFNSGRYPCTGSFVNTYYSYYTGGYNTGYYTSYFTGYVGGPVHIANGGVLTPYNKTVAWVSYSTGGYMTGYNTQYYTGYYGGSGSTGYYNTGGYGRSGVSGCYWTEIPYISQLVLNIIMACAGLLSVVISLIAATLACAPLCCNPEKNNQLVMKSVSYGVEPFIDPPIYSLPVREPGKGVTYLDIPEVESEKK